MLWYQRPDFKLVKGFSHVKETACSAWGSSIWLVKCYIWCAPRQYTWAFAVPCIHQRSSLLNNLQLRFVCWRYCPSSTYRNRSDWSASEWCKSWLITLKTEKCEVLHITRKKDPIRCQYSLNNISLPEVDHNKHLGLWLEPSLSWDYHINSICAKANRVIKRTSGYSNKTGIKTAFKALVIPILEYACSEPLSDEAHQGNRSNSEKSVPTNMWPRQKIS